jgi:hypothetical protein
MIIIYYLKLSNITKIIQYFINFHLKFNNKTERFKLNSTFLTYSNNSKLLFIISKKSQTYLII